MENKLLIIKKIFLFFSPGVSLEYSIIMVHAAKYNLVVVHVMQFYNNILFIFSQAIAFL